MTGIFALAGKWCSGPALLALVLACSERPPSAPALGSVAQALGVLQPTWTPTESMKKRRARHTATLLLDGRVLLVGGAEATPGDLDLEIPEVEGLYGSPVEIAEYYDPATGNFSLANIGATSSIHDSVGPGGLHVPRWGHTATLLRDGRVLIAGGFDASFNTVHSVEVFDPVTESFALVAKPTHARALHTATLLPTGDVLLAGGVSDLGLSLNEIAPEVVRELEVYRVRQDRFDTWSTANRASFPHAAALLEGGEVALAWPGQSSIELDIVDSNSGQIRPGASIDCGDLPCGDGLVAYRDPWVPDSLALASSYVSAVVDPLQPETRSAQASFSFQPSPVGSGALVGITGQEVLLQGGSEVLYRDPLGYTGTGDDVLEKRRWGAATALPTGELLVTGGGDVSASTVRRREALTASPLQLVAANQNQPDTLLYGPNEQSAIALLQDGRVLFSGGIQPASNGLDPLGVYAWDLRADPSGSAELTHVGDVAVARVGHQAFVLPSGEVLFAGGDQGGCEVFNVETGTTKPLDLSSPAQVGIDAGHGRLVFAHEAAKILVDTRDFSIQLQVDAIGCEKPGLLRMPSGEVLVVGKRNAYLVDPSGKASDREVAFPANPGCDVSLTALPDGNVLLSGGTDVNGEPRREAIVYDLAKGEVRARVDAPGAFVGAPAMMRFGEVLLLGAAGPTDAEEQVPLLFDWSRTTFRKADFMVPSALASSLSRFTSAMQLPNGGVLVTGITGQSGAYVIDRANRGPSLLPRPGKALVVRAGKTVDLESLPFSFTWPENSSGDTSSSPSNAPVPVWIPAQGGWPEVGAFVAWSEHRATWRVPHTPFPGLGVLTFARSGILYPLAMAVIQGADLGEACKFGGECGSGACVDGVCCDSQCDEACMACTAVDKASGGDGTCGPRKAGAFDASCQPTVCRETGVCNDIGGCDFTPEGTACEGDGACSFFRCLHSAPVSVCDGDHTVTTAALEADCAPFRCSLAKGTCLEACSTNVDCIDGAVCAAGKCTLVKPARKSLGCAPGCYLAASPRADVAAWGLSLLGLLALKRRRQNPRPTAAKTADFARCL